MIYEAFLRMLDKEFAMTKKDCCVCGKPATSYGFDVPARRIYNRFYSSCRDRFEARLAEEKEKNTKYINVQRWLDIIEELRD